MEGNFISTLVAIVLFAMIIVGYWRLFEKADQPGFLAIIPIVNVIVYFMISERPWWVIILLFIPIVQLFALFYIHLGVAEKFGQGGLFALGLLFLPFIFILLLAFGDYRVVGGRKAYNY